MVSSHVRVVVGSFLMLAVSGNAVAGTVTGKLETPPAPDRPPPSTRGFLERIENPIAPPKKVAITPYVVVALDGGAAADAPGQRVWELVGESFAAPVFGVPAGAEVLIKNVSRTARSFSALEDDKLVPRDPINPNGTRSFRVTEPKVYTIADRDAAHLRGVLVVVPGKFVTTVDDSGRFTFTDVPEGTYKLRVFYKDAWSDAATDVTVGKGKTEVNPKLPAVTPAKK